MTRQRPPGGRRAADPTSPAPADPTSSAPADPTSPAPTVPTSPAPAPRRAIAVVGPTAVGKSAVALTLAEAVGGEIVSLDSRQMVRRVEIGTAKPTPEERARAPHHLVDVVSPDAPVSLAAVQSMAQAAIDAILERGRVPIAVGGTGQYMRAVVEGWTIPEVRPDPERRAALEALALREGHAVLHDRLRALDPAEADRIDARNVRRVIRAIEIVERTGGPVANVRARAGSPYDWLIVGLIRPRASLYARVDARIDAMLAAGLEAEVRALVAAGVGFDRPAMSSVGYREWRGYFAGEVDRDEVVRLIRRDTRRLVRVQANWFRLDDPRIHWFDLDADGTAPVRILALARRFLAGEAAVECAADGPTGGTPAEPSTSRLPAGVRDLAAHDDEHHGHDDESG